MDFAQLKQLLEKHGQQQLIAFWNEISEDERENLASQIQKIDFNRIDELIKEYVLKKPETDIPDDLTPAPFFPLIPDNEGLKSYYEVAKQTGADIIRQGKVACLTVAGGQGTRLGFDGPKGTYPIGPVSGKSLFAYFAEGIARNQEKYSTRIPWYIMTSVVNNAQTVEFFEQNNYFGLDKQQVFFFVQGTMPAVGYDGKILLASKSSLALSPDGHGGTLWALRQSGALDKMKNEGTQFLSYFQVDNPLVAVVDQLFIGLHALEKSQMSAIMLPKTGPFEKLGNFCVSKNRTCIIEYSDLPESLAESRNPDGSLKFLAGSPAIHVISTSFIEKLTDNGKPALPWHRADKKVPFVDSNGALIKPETPNAVKLESFIFDALPLAEKTMILEADRNESFGPTKNATGVDSAESCREMLIARDKRRLKAANVDIANAEKVEIAPRIAVCDEDVEEYCRKNNISSLANMGREVYLK